MKTLCGRKKREVSHTPLQRLDAVCKDGKELQELVSLEELKMNIDCIVCDIFFKLKAMVLNIIFSFKMAFMEICFLLFTQKNAY